MSSTRLFADCVLRSSPIAYMHSSGQSEVGSYISIALDSSNCVHISYRDDTNDDLKYAHNACPDNDRDG